MAFNAKNLTYDKSEPAFLRRLKAGYASQDGRNNVQHARSGKSRLKMDDGDDDEPVILDESGEVVGKEEFEGMVKGETKGSGNGDGASNKGEDLPQNDEGDDGKDGQDREQGEREKQRVAEVGGTKKRKAVKVVGGVDDGEHENDETMKASGAVDADSDHAAKNGKSAKDSKPKKKAKKIKLSFDDPE